MEILTPLRGGHRGCGFPPFLPSPRRPVGCLFCTRESQFLGENREVRVHCRAGMCGAGPFEWGIYVI